VKNNSKEAKENPWESKPQFSQGTTYFSCANTIIAYTVLADDDVKLLSMPVYSRTPLPTLPAVDIPAAPIHAKAIPVLRPVQAPVPPITSPAPSYTAPADDDVELLSMPAYSRTPLPTLPAVDIPAAPIHAKAIPVLRPVQTPVPPITSPAPSPNPPSVRRPTHQRTVSIAFRPVQTLVPSPAPSPNPPYETTRVVVFRRCCGAHSRRAV